MRRSIRGMVLVVLLSGCSPSDVEQWPLMPARFEGQRIFVDLPMPDVSDTLRLYTDTGGGLFLYGTAADRLSLADSGGVLLSASVGNSTFPDPLGAEGGRLPIFRPEEMPHSDFDGMLGQAWFADRVWTIDYPGQELRLGASPAQDAPSVPLAFLTDSLGVRMASFPRIQARVANETLDLLFDTGAMLHPTTRATEELQLPGATPVATSFITTEVFERWQQDQPGWRVIQGADSMLAGMAMIEVPELEIAGFTVGPVWFTQRPNANFHEFMAQFMDRPVDGALGGNALRFFTVTVDYPNGTATFEPPVR